MAGHGRSRPGDGMPTVSDELGERVIPSSRRPDGTMRKEIRVRAGYIPQDEVERYVARGSRPRNSGPDLPPGLDPEFAAAQAAAKKKAAKKNEKRKEKKAAASASGPDVAAVAEGLASVSLQQRKQDSPLATSQGKGEDAVAQSLDAVAPAREAETASQPAVEKQLRNIRKKIRQAETLEVAIASSGRTPTGEELEKIGRLSAWREEAAQLEAELSPS